MNGKKKSFSTIQGGKEVDRRMKLLWRCIQAMRPSRFRRERIRERFLLAVNPGRGTCKGEKGGDEMGKFHGLIGKRSYLMNLLAAVKK